MGDISEHFSRAEFACKCGCGFDDISLELIKRLEVIRKYLHRPIVITSGCRCVKYNAKVGGKPDSAHTKGLAADIAVSNSSERYKLLLLCFNYFHRIGIAKDFIHVDVDGEKPSDVCWLY